LLPFPFLSNVEKSVSLLHLSKKMPSLSPENKIPCFWICQKVPSH
jgi:hypothetical protein